LTGTNQKEAFTSMAGMTAWNQKRPKGGLPLNAILLPTNK